MTKALQSLLHLLVISVGWWVIAAVMPAPAAAQAPVEPLTPPLAQSLILEHTHTGTVVVNQTLKVGNIPLSGLKAGGLISNVTYYRGYLQFDLSTFPPGAHVQHARLTFSVDRFDYPYPSAPAPGTPLTCGVYSVTETWQSAGVWVWADNPAVITPTAMTRTILFGHTGTYTIDVTGLVQGWAAGKPNHGLLVGLSPDPDGIAPFTAVLHGPAAISETLRPRLEIVYQPPASSWQVYLPFVLRSADLRPDLSVEIVTPVDSVNPAALQLQITNMGRSPATGFWVDLYLDPTTPPETNRPWPTLCPVYGAAWQIPVLESGASLTLSIGGPFYSVIDSQWPTATYPTGTHAVWAYADSWSDRPWGWINETDETNNRAGPVTFTVSTAIHRPAVRKPETFLPRPTGGH